MLLSMEMSTAEAELTSRQPCCEGCAPWCSWRLPGQPLSTAASHGQTGIKLAVGHGTGKLDTGTKRPGDEMVIRYESRRI